MNAYFVVIHMIDHLCCEEMSSRKESGSVDSFLSFSIESRGGVFILFLFIHFNSVCSFVCWRRVYTQTVVHRSLAAGCRVEAEDDQATSESLCTSVCETHRPKCKWRVRIDYIGRDFCHHQ